MAGARGDPYGPRAPGLRAQTLESTTLIESARRVNRFTVRVCWSEPGYLSPLDGRDHGCDFVQLRDRTFWLRDGSVWDGAGSGGCESQSLALNTTSCAPSHSVSSPSSRMCSAPDSIVRKWLPASWPTIEENMQPP